MAVGGRVLGEAFVVISPDVSDFLAELTTKVKVAVSSMPQQNVKVGLDASPVNAGIAALRTQLGTALAKAAELKITGDDGPLTKMMAGIAARGAALQKQLGNLVMAADTTKLDAAIAKETTKLTGLRQLLQRLEMGADTTRIDKAIAKEEAAVTKLKQQMSDLQLNADDKELAYKIERDIELVESLQARIAKRKELGADTSALRAQLDFVEARLAVLQEEGRVRLDADVTALLAGIAVAQDKISRLRAEAESARLMNPKQIAETQAQIAATTAEITRLNAEAAKAKLAGLDPVVMAKIAQGVAGVTADVNAMHDAFRKMADTGPLLGPVTAQMARLQEQSGAITKALDDIHISGDDLGMQAKLDALLFQSVKLRAALADIPVDADPVAMARMTAQFSALDADVEKFRKSLEKPVVVPATAALTDLQRRAAGLAVQLGDLRVKVDGDAAMTARLSALQFQAEKLKATLADTAIGGDPVKLAQMVAETDRLAAGTEKLARAADDAGNKTSLLAQYMQRFAAANQGIGWGAAIGGITGWHIALDAAIEATIIAAGVTAALGATAAVVYPIIDQLAYHTRAAFDVMTAYGVDAGPLAKTTKQMDLLRQSLAPQVFEGFGGVLSLLGNHFNDVAGAARAVVNMFDTWIAKIDIWAGGQKSMNGLFQAGVGFLQQIGKAIGIFAQAIDNLLTKDPGIAHYLLNLIQGLAMLINLFSRLPAPVVQATLMIHGFYLWISVLLGVVGKLAAPLAGLATGFVQLALGKEALTIEKDATALDKLKASASLLGPSLAALAANPWTWLAILAAGLGYAAYEMTQASSSAKNLTASMTGALNQMSASDAIVQAGKDVGQLRQAIAQVPAAAGNMELSLTDAATKAGNLTLAAVKGAPEMLASWHNLGREISNVGGAITNGVHAFMGWMGIGPQIRQNSNNVQQYTGAIVSLSKEQSNLFNETGKLIYNQNQLHLGTMSYTQALTLMDLAGVKASDSLAVMNQKISNLVTAYNEIGAGGPQLQASINAVTFATELQDSKVTELNSGWDTFFKTVSGGVGGFLTFAQQINGMNEAFSGATQGSVALSISNGRVSDSMRLAAGAAQSGAASMTGLNDASIQAQQTLLQSATAANAQMDALTTLSAAAGMGQHGMDLLQQATKDMLSTMLPAAQGSQAMTDVLYALAQRGGYKGADSFQALSNWISTNSGSVKNATPGMQDLQGIMTQMTTAAGSLTTDVQNLSVALGQTLTDAMSKAIVQASGGQKAFDQFATAVLNSKFNSQQQQTAALALGQSLVKITGNVSDAKNQFLSFAIGGLHMTSQQANQLWNEIAPKLTPAVKDSGDKTAKAKTDFENFAVHGLHLTTGKADELWQKMKGPLGGVLDDLAKSKAPGAKKAFEDLAGDPKKGLGLSKKQADDLWTSLHGNLGKELSTLGGPGGDVMKSKAAFEAWAGQGGKSGLSLAKWQADQLYTALTGKGGLQSGIDSLHGKTVKITVDTSQADKAIAGIQQRLGTDIGGGTLGPTGRAGIGKQRGGLITTGTGPTADDVQVLASRGEYVVRAASVSQYGTGLLDALNAGIVPPGSRLVHPMDLSQGTAGLAHALAQRPALHPAAVPTANVPHAVTAAPPRGFAAGFAAGGLIGYAAGGPVTAAPAGGGGGGGGGTISLAGMIAQLSGQLQALFTQRIPAWLNSFADQGKTTFTKLANSLQTILASVLNAMFTTKMPVWLTGTENSFRKLWTMAAGDFHNALVIPVQAFFTSSVPTWLTSTGNGNRTTWATAGNDFRNGLVTPVQQFFTSTVPGDFNALDTKARQTFDDVNAYFSGHVDKPIATAISAWSGDISNAFKSGWNATAQQFNSSVVNWINANILKNLPGSLSIQPIPGFAGGGHIPGSGNADSHLALLTPGEYVVRKGAVSALERRQPGVMDLINSADTLPRLQSGGPGYQMAGGGLIPAYATGGSVYQNPLRAISGLVGERIDMGVDFAGTGSLYAIGPGTITSIMNSGWPPYPGAFIDEVFSAGPASGRHFYFAEDIRPSVSIGQQVDSNTVIGQMYAGKEGIEAGWASGVGGQTLAAYFHQQAGAGDPGSVSTAYGASANAFLVSLGAPGGRLQGGGVRGTVAGGFPSPGGYGAGGAAVAVMWQVLEGLLDPTGTKLSTATAKLSPYVQGGAPELLKLANQGAQAIFDAIWKNAVVPRLSTLPASTIPGGYAHLTAALLDKGISGYMKAKDDAAKTSAAATGVPSVGQPGGTATPGLITVAQYVMAHGGTKEAGAGVAGTVAGESGGNPESVGSGGAGLIGWTPPSSAKPFFPIVTGNPGKDMAVQLVDMMYYIAGRGGIGLINAAGASGGPQAAAQAFSRMEAPAVPYSDIRPSIVDQLFKAGYDKGGVLRPGVTLAVNRTGHDETVLAMPPHRVAGIMRHAAGGLAGYQQKLSSDQAAELRDYAAFTAAARYSLAHAAPGSYVSRDRSSILGEMSTLAARQASEAAAYKPVTSANVTAAQIAHLITAINGMVTVTRDIALGHLPGGSLVTLRNLLTAMAKSAALEPSLPATPKPGASSLFWDWKAPSGTISLSDFWTQVISGEVTEKATYAAVASAFRKSLAAAKPGAWDYVHRAVLGSELQTLALRQNEEISAYNALVATKGTTGNRPGAAQLSRYLASLKSMATTVRDADLSHVPGGHPAEMTTMYADLGGLHQIAGQSIGDPTAPFPALFAPYTLPKRGTPAYATLASIFGWYDRGGILPPGLTLAYNATGRNEIVSPVPPGAVYGPGGMTPGEMQLVNRLDRLITLMSSAPAAYSQALSGVAGQAASRGIYGSR